MSACDTYPYTPDTSDQEARHIWTAPPSRAYVAIDAGRVVGTYMLRPNQPGLGSHVANAGFMVARDERGRGVGRAMGEHALEQARLKGYVAMQFNSVVSSNERAVGLWKSLGFEIVGTAPGAFRHGEKGLVAIHIMHRWL